MSVKESSPGVKLQEAFQIHQKGLLDQADLLYRQILDQEPSNFGALHLLGVLRGQLGKHAEAISLLGKALKIKPSDFGARSNYGLALAATGRYEDAISNYDQAIAVKPDFFQAHYNRGIALAGLKRYREAVGSFENGLALRSDSAECWYNRGLGLASLGERDMALESYDKSLALKPQFADALINRGNLLRELGRLDAALESYDRAAGSSPANAAIAYNKAIALFGLGRHQEAISNYDMALGIDPRFAEAFFNRATCLIALGQLDRALASIDSGLAIRASDVKALGDRALVLYRLGRLDEALAACNRTLALNPKHAPALMTRGLVSQQATRFAEALADYDQLLTIEPEYAMAWNNRGAVLHAMNRTDQALASFEKAVDLRPDFPEALASRGHLRWTYKGDFEGAVSDLMGAIAIDPDQAYVQGELLHLKMQVADWTDFDRQVAAIDQAVRDHRPVIRPFIYQALSQSPADLQTCSRIFASSLFSSTPEKIQIPKRNHPKIRIGYLSGEFREQATAYLMAGVYELHDRDRFEILAIDNTCPDESRMRKRLEAAFDKIIDISNLPDKQAAQRICEAEVDILVNLNGYFGAPRAGVFAHRPAPLQVNYLGFPATLGASYIDYIFADSIVIAQGEEGYYDEAVVWLPHSYQANDCKRSVDEKWPDRASLGLPEKAFVFCNFNQSYKLCPRTFASWMRILRQTENSVLWLLKSQPPFAENLRNAAMAQHVDSERLIFAPPVEQEDHLARLKQADLFLDSLPYNAHTTASDALWAGLPLLTCRGTAFPGRVAASLLNAVGLPELIAETMPNYEALAVRLAREPALMEALKKKLAIQRNSFPLFDTNLFCRNIEAAYNTIWQRWSSGLPAKGFAVEPAQQPTP
jgi:protein O-GlcNAc transferase